MTLMTNKRHFGIIYKFKSTHIRLYPTNARSPSFQLSPLLKVHFQHTDLQKSLKKNLICYSMSNTAFKCKPMSRIIKILSGVIKGAMQRHSPCR